MTDKSPSAISSKTVHDTSYAGNNADDWQNDFGLTHDPKKDSIWHEPVWYYLADENCSGLAKDFYFGFLKPSDNGVTEELLKLACSDNKKLRPFYRWCLNKVLIVSDGALGELVGVPARKYAEQFPEEFFEYMDENATDDKYGIWVNAILYSGFYDYDDSMNNLSNRKKLIREMTNNLSDKKEGMEARIVKFATDCTPEETR